MYLAVDIVRKHALCVIPVCFGQNFFTPKYLNFPISVAVSVNHVCCLHRVPEVRPQIIHSRKLQKMQSESNHLTQTSQYLMLNAFIFTVENETLQKFKKKTC